VALVTAPLDGPALCRIGRPIQYPSLNQEVNLFIPFWHCRIRHRMEFHPRNSQTVNISDGQDPYFETLITEVHVLFSPL